MAKSRKKSRRPSLKRRLLKVLGPPTDRKLIVELLKELHHIVLDTGAELGASPKDRRRAIELALKDPKRLRPSEAAARSSVGMAAILNSWRNDKRYRGPNGTPRVLPIKGKGATLERLARRFVPQMAISGVVRMMCENAEVTRLKGNRIALVGSPVMKTQKTPEATLASLVRRVRRLSETIVYDATIPAGVTGTGRFERMVTGELTDKEFSEFFQPFRPQLQAVCDQVDEGIGQPTKSRRRRGRTTCGLGIYVFKDDGNIG
jgi:hypothetical protein